MRLRVRATGSIVGQTGTVTWSRAGVELGDLSEEDVEGEPEGQIEDDADNR